MYRKRTDLAIEERELHPEKRAKDGLAEETREENGVRITTLSVAPGEGEKRAKRRAGTYITLEVGGVAGGEDAQAQKAAAEVLARELQKLLPEERGCVLVVGLGNERITPDAVGPRVAEKILVTRHVRLLNGELFREAGFGETAALVPGVLGQTGIESAEIVRSVVERIRPVCVIAIDALASRRLSRLASTIQISDGGISPGSGVFNRRAPLSEETLGVRVISVGVPTVVDAATLAYDLLEEVSADEPLNGRIIEKLLSGSGKELFIAPRDCDAVTEGAARLIAEGINLALHPGMTPEELEAYGKT